MASSGEFSISLFMKQADLGAAFASDLIDLRMGYPQRIMRGLSNCKGGFIPRWVKRKVHKNKPVCCVPITSERVCAFAPFDAVCAAVKLEHCLPTLASPSGPVSLCTQHYHAAYKHYSPEEILQCALCGFKRRHRASGRPLDQYHNHRLLRF